MYRIRIRCIYNGVFGRPGTNLYQSQKTFEQGKTYHRNWAKAYLILGGTITQTYERFNGTKWVRVGSWKFTRK